MNKNKYFLVWLIVLFLISPTVSSAYNLSIDVGQWGNVNYAYPAVLGDDNKSEEKKEEKREEKKEEKREVRESVKIEKPERIEIKKEENKTRVTLKKQEKIEQKLTPEKVSVKFGAVPKTTPVEIRKTDDVDDVDDVDDDTDEIVKERMERKNEKVEIQSETHDDGTVEMQIESRMVKAKIKDGEMELDIKNNNVGASDDNGDKVELIHLPDQAMQKFLDLGLTMTPDSLEVGQSGNKFEYSIDTVKQQRLFGLIPRQAKFKLKLDDSTGTVTEQAVANNIVDTILNLFSF